MNHLQIECFLAVAKHMSFSKAAQERYTSQPSISKHIRKLEEYVGVRLFDRSAPSLCLTPEGEKFRDFFLESSRTFRALQEEALAASQSCHKLRIAFLQGSSFFDDLFPIFNQLLSANPHLDIDVSFCGFKAITDAFSSMDADIIIHLDELMPRLPGMHVEPLVKIPKFLFFRRDLFPADAQPTALSDFADTYFLVTDEMECSGVKQSNLRQTAEFDFEPKFKYVPNIESMIWGVKHGDGVAIMDSSIAWGSAPIGSIKLREQHTVIMVWPEQPSNPVVKLFADRFLEALRESPLCFSSGE